MKDILIVAHFTQVSGEFANGRFHYIIKKINKKNINLEVITTSFSHKLKRQRVVTGKQRNDSSYKLTMLYEPGYKKNVSLKRFYSHFILGRNLKKYLKNRKKPDIIYCAVPSLDLAKVAAQYAIENKIKFIIDIQDLWPEAFKMVFNIPLISGIIFFPMKKQADYIYRAADEIIAVSQTYVDRALEINKKCKEGKSIYLGTDLGDFDSFMKNNRITNKPPNEIWLAYIGTLGRSYDLMSVIDALKILNNKGISNIKFIVMGDGPLKNKFEEYANEKNIYTDFTGRLSYEKMVGTLAVCDIAINPIRKGSAGSIINKVGDYAAAGLPVVNTQECDEYIDLLNIYKAGITCICEDARDISEKIYKLYSNEQLRKEMGTNNRLLAEEKFDRKRTYNEILCLLEDANYQINNGK